MGSKPTQGVGYVCVLHVSDIVCRCDIATGRSLNQAVLRRSDFLKLLSFSLQLHCLHRTTLSLCFNEHRTMKTRGKMKSSVLNKSNETQQYAGIYLPLKYSTCFGRPSRPSSGVHKTVVASCSLWYRSHCLGSKLLQM